MIDIKITDFSADLPVGIAYILLGNWVTVIGRVETAGDCLTPDLYQLSLFDISLPIPVSRQFQCVDNPTSQ